MEPVILRGEDELRKKRRHLRRYSWDPKMGAKEKMKVLDPCGYMKRDRDSGFVISRGKMGISPQAEDWFQSIKIQRRGSRQMEPIPEFMYGAEQSERYQRKNSNEENIQLVLVKEQRLRLAKIIPSLAKEIEAEKTGFHNMMKSCSHVQANIIDHLQKYIEETSIPAMQELDDIRNELYFERQNSKREADSLNMENAFLTDRVEEVYAANAEALNKVKRLEMSNLQYQKKLEERDMEKRTTNDNMLQDMAEEMNSMKTKLSSAHEELERQSEERQQLEEVLTSFYQKINELKLERDFAKSQTRKCEEQMFEMHKTLEERNHEITQVRSETLLLEHRLSNRHLESPSLSGFDRGRLDSTEMIEIPFIPDMDQGELPNEMFNVYHDGDVEIYSLNTELEVEEYENSDDLWLDGEISSESFLTKCDSVSEILEKTEDDNEEEEQAEKEKSCSPQQTFNTRSYPLNEHPIFTMVRNESIDISDITTSEPITSKNSKWVRGKRKRRKVGTAYNQRKPKELQRIHAKGAKDFSEALALFKKLEKVNPNKIKAPGEQTKYVKDMISMLKSNSRQKLGVPVKAGTGKVVARVRKKPKYHFLNPRRKGYLQIPKSSRISRKWALKFGYKFYVCLDGLPCRTNTDVSEPFWAKDRTDEDLHPSIFWFENEEKFKILQKATAAMHVRSKEFQAKFAELAMGVVVISPESTVNTSERRAIDRLRAMTGKDVAISLDIIECPEKSDGSESNFFLVVKSWDDESFDSHKFCAENDAQRDKWILHIQKFLTRRLLHQTSAPSAKSSPRAATSRKAGDSNKKISSRSNIRIHRDSASMKPSNESSNTKGKSTIPYTLKKTKPKKIVIQLNGDDDDGPVASTNNFRQDVGKLAMAFDRKASKIKKERERTRVRRTLSMERKLSGKGKSRIGRRSQKISRIPKRKRAKTWSLAKAKSL